MTYGWALLIIVIVLAALVALNPISTPATCRFDQVGFGCNELPTMNTQGKLYLRVTNSQNNDISIIDAVCIDDKSATPPAWGATPLYGNGAASLLVPRQGMVDLSTAQGKAVTCHKGSVAGPSSFSVGEEFSGRVWIKYRNTEDPATYPNRTASATVTMKVA